MKDKFRVAMFGHKRIPSREGGIEIVVEELCTRMVEQGNEVTCFNRAGHHVSGAEYDKAQRGEYKGIRLKTVPTIDKKGSGDIIRGCHNRDKGTVEKKRLHDLTFIFSYPKNEQNIFLDGWKAARKEISTKRAG